MNRFEVGDRVVFHIDDMPKHTLREPIVQNAMKYPYLTIIGLQGSIYICEEVSGKWSGTYWKLFEIPTVCLDEELFII